MHQALKLESVKLNELAHGHDVTLHVEALERSRRQSQPVRESHLIFPDNLRFHRHRSAYVRHGGTSAIRRRP